MLIIIIGFHDYYTWLYLMMYITTTCDATHFIYWPNGRSLKKGSITAAHEIPHHLLPELK